MSTATIIKHRALSSTQLGLALAFVGMAQACSGNVTQGRSGTGGATGGAPANASTGGGPSASGGSPATSSGGAEQTGGSGNASGGSDGSGGNATGGVNGDTGGTPGAGGAPATGGTGGASASVPGSSCDGLPSTCGPQENESCCSSPLIPGGMFYRGEITDNGSPATLSDFRLDRFETTVGRYRNFVAAYDAWRAAGHPMAGEGQHPHTPGTGWDPAWTTELLVRAPNAATLRQNLACAGAETTWSNNPGPHDNRPVGCVNWYQAVAFCIWDGGFLPTEAQFNYAQTGGNERRYLPWSSPPSAEQYDRKYASYECGIENGLEDCIFKVGAHPLGDGKFGQADLGGNVWEWTLDWEMGYPDPCQDCSSVLDPDGPQSDGRILRGGGWPNGSSGMRAGYRIGHDPQAIYGSGIGFRCARTP